MIYVASKVAHADLWKFYRSQGYPINSTWIDEARDKESPSLPDLWRRCIEEASSAKVLVAYTADGEAMKGALVEIGAALANGVPVYYVGPECSSWHKHRLVTRFANLEDAMREANRLVNPTPYDRLRARIKEMAARQEHYGDRTVYQTRTLEEAAMFQHCATLLRALLREFS